MVRRRKLRADGLRIRHDGGRPRADNSRRVPALPSWQLVQRRAGHPVWRELLQQPHAADEHGRVLALPRGSHLAAGFDEHEQLHLQGRVL